MAYTIETVKKKVIELNKNIEVISEEYINADTILTFKCKECGYEFKLSYKNFRQNPTCRKEYHDWLELCDYIKYKILKYSEEQKFPKYLCERLKGLKDGVFIANKRIKPNGNYSFSVILLAFKIKQFDIINAIKNKEFNNEKQKINYIMAIVENTINDAYLKLTKMENTKEVVNNIEIVDNYEDKKVYKKRTTEINNNRLKGLI